MGFITRASASARWAAEGVVHAVARAGERVARAARPSTASFRQLQSWSTTTWTVEQIKVALELHETGNFSESAKLSAAFGRDDRITACRNTRIRALVGKNGTALQLIASQDGDQRSAGTIKARVERRFYKTCSEAVLSRIQKDAIDIGVSISRIHWIFDTAAQEWVPFLEPWDLEWVRWDEQLGCYVAQTEGHGEVQVHYNTGEWLIVEPAGARGWNAGAVRALALAFFFRNSTWTDWARYCEKHGVPILAIEEPAVQNDPAQKATKDRFFAALRRLGREGILRLPKSADGKSNYDASFIEPKTLSYPAFEKFLTRLDVCIAVFLLGQNLSTEVSGGSFAAALAQNRIRLDYLSADAEALSTALREQVWMWWGRFNFENWNDANTPWAQWNTSLPEDMQAKATTMAALATAIGPLIAAGMPIAVRELAAQYGIPVLSVEEAIKEAEEAAKRIAQQAVGTPPANDGQEKKIA